MAEQKAQFIMTKENKQDEQYDTDMIQTKPNDNAENKKVTLEVDEKLMEGNNKTDQNLTNNATSSTSSTDEKVELAFSPKKIKKSDGEPKKVVEDNPYDLSKSITERAEKAVINFRKKYISSAMSNQMFTSYIVFGGIDTNKNKSKAQNQNQDNDADTDMEVDFTYTIRVFLSGFLIDKSGYVHIDNFREAPRVVILFLNFLFENNVFPEFEDDMREALRIAHKASEELPNCKSLDLNAPGKFNKACSLLFGGELYGALDDASIDEELAASMINISKEEGKRLIKKVFGANALEELKQVKEDSRHDIECEIIGTEPFQTNINTIDIQSADDENTIVDGDNAQTNLKKILLRERNVNAEPFYVCECSDVVNHAMPGLLITADFHKLSNGFLYWDNVTNIFPSYYLECPEEDD